MKGRMQFDGRPGDQFVYETVNTKLVRGSWYILKTKIPAISTRSYTMSGKFISTQSSPAMFSYRPVYLVDVRATGGTAVVLYEQPHKVESKTITLEVKTSQLICSEQDWKKYSAKIVKKGQIMGVTDNVEANVFADCRGGPFA